MWGTLWVNYVGIVWLIVGTHPKITASMAGGLELCHGMAESDVISFSYNANF